MHIGIDARLTAYRTGGISTYILNIVQELAKLDTPHQYTILYSRKTPTPITESFQQGFLWTPCHHRLERTALSLEISRFGLDVLHSPDFIPPRFGARGFVASIHDLSFMYYPEFMTTESLRYYRGQIEAAVQRADHLLTISESSRQGIMDLLGVPAEKITVHLLAASDVFQPQTASAVADVRRQLNIPTDYLLFVGTFEPRKNILGLLRAYQLLQQTHPDPPPLVIAGKTGWQFGKTLEKIQEMELGDCVYWRDNVTSDMLPALYSGALAQLMPSFYEGFGLPALEAMACRTVPIVSNTSSLPEVVGDIGLQVDPKDPAALCEAIHHTITDTAWRTAQEEAAYQRSKQFTWEKTARVAHHVYERVLS